METVIGVHNIFMNPRRRKFKFTLGIRKYHREDFDDYINIYGEYGLDFVYKQLSEYRKSDTAFDIISWLPSDKDLREIFQDLNDAAAAHFELANEEINFCYIIVILPNKFDSLIFWYTFGFYRRCSKNWFSINRVH